MPEIQSNKETALSYAEKLQRVYDHYFNVEENLKSSGAFGVNTEYTQSTQAASSAFLSIASLLRQDGKKIESIASYLEQKDEENALRLLSVLSE